MSQSICDGETIELSSISLSRSVEEIGAFWDEHDFTEFDTDLPDVEFEVSVAVPVEDGKQPYDVGQL